jgi:hypothetical protein
MMSQKKNRIKMVGLALMILSFIFLGSMLLTVCLTGTSNAALGTEKRSETEEGLK